MHVNLVIATPGHSVMAAYLRSLLAATRELDRRGISWAFSQEYSSHVADAREMTLNGGNQNIIKDSRPFRGEITYDKILWIDSDIMFTPEDVIRAYESPLDVVSGAYTLASGEVVAYDKLFGEAFSMNQVKEMKEPRKIFGAGMGFFCMKSGIFESLSRPWFQSVPATALVDGEEFTFPIMGEDLSLCKRINDAGFEIWLDPEIKLIHHKTFKLTWEGLAL
jgi:hypothetical protein